MSKNKDVGEMKRLAEDELHTTKETSLSMSFENKNKRSFDDFTYYVFLLDPSQFYFCRPLFFQLQMRKLTDYIIENEVV